MAAELLYRFCVREKSGEASKPANHAVFITRYFLSEPVARERFDVIERLEHTAIHPVALLTKLAWPVD
ncbi:hypothetical protein [Zoogloea sp. LCSB751]|uniref:hypothetical protein n=1 Tax=Zoogloea sp. LCSB751 TaxID=1965277 RepID=UPI001117266D|nr:hypothetical protein [Zoogloea sp. LCSB751]